MIKKSYFYKIGHYILTVVHETGNLKKNHVPLCPPVLLMASARFHRPEENNQSEPSWSLAVSEQLSITRKLRSNGQTRQR